MARVMPSGGRTSRSASARLRCKLEDRQDQMLVLIHPCRRLRQPEPGQLRMCGRAGRARSVGDDVAHDATTWDLPCELVQGCWVAERVSCMTLFEPRD